MEDGDVLGCSSECFFISVHWHDLRGFTFFSSFFFSLFKKKKEKEKKG